MGNAESSSGGGGGHGEKDNQSGLDDARTVAVAVAVAYVTCKITTRLWSFISQQRRQASTGVEEEENQGIGQHSDWRSENPYIPKGKGSCLLFFVGYVDDELQQQTKATTGVAAVADAVWSRPPNGRVNVAAAVASGSYMLMSHSEAEEETTADQLIRERAGWSSSSPFIREGKGRTVKEKNLGTGQRSDWSSEKPYIPKGKGTTTGVAAVADAVWSRPPNGWVNVAAAVASGSFMLMSHSEVEEETTADQRMRERAGWSSSSPFIREGNRRTVKEENLGTGQRSDWSSEKPYILEGKGRAAAVAVWSRPPNGWVKLNTDFSEPSGMGCIIRNHRAKLLYCCAERVDDCIITDDVGATLWSFSDRVPSRRVLSAEGEALALLRGLQIARDLGYRKVVAETDHKSNTDSINKVKYRGSYLIKRIQKAKCSWFDECHIGHIERKRNRCADHLAGVVAKSGASVPFQSIRNSPALKKLLQEDRTNHSGSSRC